MGLEFHTGKKFGFRGLVVLAALVLVIGPSGLHQAWMLDMLPPALLAAVAWLLRLMIDRRMQLNQYRIAAPGPDALEPIRIDQLDGWS